MFVCGRGKENDFKENSSDEGLLFCQKFVSKCQLLYRKQ